MLSNKRSFAKRKCYAYSHIHTHTTQEERVLVSQLHSVVLPAPAFGGVANSDANSDATSFSVLLRSTFTKHRILHEVLELRLNRSRIIHRFGLTGCYLCGHVTVKVWGTSLPACAVWCCFGDSTGAVGRSVDPSAHMHARFFYASASLLSLSHGSSVSRLGISQLHRRLELDCGKQALVWESFERVCPPERCSASLQHGYSIRLPFFWFHVERVWCGLARLEDARGLQG